MSRTAVFIILSLLGARFMACSSNYGQVREFYLERGTSHCGSGKWYYGNPADSQAVISYSASEGGPQAPVAAFWRKLQ